MTTAPGLSPASAADFYRAALPPGDLYLIALHELDRFGVPVWSASLWPDGAAAGIHGAGYGTDDAQARAGALGELAEEAAVGPALARVPRTRASYAQLGPERAVDPRTLCLPAGSWWRPEQELVWVVAHRHPSGEEVLVPVEFAASSAGGLPADRSPLITPVTNGLGAGDTLERALAHGLLELLQRDGNSVAYRALDRRVGVQLDAVADAGTRALLERLDAAGLHVEVKLAATDLGFANLYAVGWDSDLAAASHPLMVTSCGEACHPDRERALRKAVCELLSSRVRKAFSHGSLELAATAAPAGYLDRVCARPVERGEERALRAMLAWLDLDAPALRGRLASSFHRVEERVPFSSLPTVAPEAVDDPADLLELVAARLADEGLDALWVDLSPPGGALRVVHAIVPGLEVETATYHRIGARNLARLAATHPELAGATGPAPAGARPVRHDRTGDAWLHPQRMDAAVGDLYPLYREPDRHVAARLR